jgi:hypothetical protein
VLHIAAAINSGLPCFLRQQAVELGLIQTDIQLLREMAFASAFRPRSILQKKQINSVESLHRRQDWSHRQSRHMTGAS